MELNIEIVKCILACDWLVNCGMKDKFIKDNDFERLTSVVQAEKKINTIKWENTCLEARNTLTGYLARNYSDIYNKYWNIWVDQIKEEILPKVLHIIVDRLKEKNFSPDIIGNIQFDVINIIMVLSYREYYQSPFYEELFCVYENGHLPCGWSGRYPKGKLLVY